MLISVAQQCESVIIIHLWHKYIYIYDWFAFCVYISSVQSLSHVRLFETPWTAAHQASLSTVNSWSLLRLMSIESVMPSNHLILCHPLLLPPPIFPSIRVFSNESFLCIRRPKYWSVRVCMWVCVCVCVCVSPPFWASFTVHINVRIILSASTKNSADNWQELS